MQIPVLLDHARREALTTQLVNQLREAIRARRIPPGTRLPSSRLLAEQLAVSRNTVIRAYDTLIVEGFVESRPASGTFVSERPPEKLASLLPTAGVIGDSGHASAMPMPAAPTRLPAAGGHHRGRLSFDFFPGRTSPSLFPIKAWRRLLQAALSDGGPPGLSQPCDPAGLPALRSAIAHHLAASRGIVADPSRIIVVCGAQEGVSLAARLFLGPDSLCVVEDPCRQSVAFAFEATGAEIAGVGVDAEGLLAEDLPRRPAALLYLTPSHQFPTGHSLSVERRPAILAWARSRGCYVLEDDRDGDFRYEGTPLPAMASQAPDCTIHVGSFSRTLGAGLRLGYMVVPAQLAAAAASAKALLNSGNPWLEQAALAEMMRGGSYAAHILRIRAHYKESRDSALTALRHNFGEAVVSGGEGGLHLLWYLPPGVPDASAVEALARRARIGVYSLASGGAHCLRSSALTHRGILLGYGGLTPKQIGQGLARLSDIIDDAVDNPAADVTALFGRAVMLPLARPAANLDSRFRRRPALPARRPQQAFSSRNPMQGMGATMAAVSKIYRYPIKGLSGQPMSCAALETGRPFPQDRIFALARPGAPIDPADPKWAKKGLFCMLMLEEELARVRTNLDLETLWFTATEGNHLAAQGSLANEADRARLEKFFWSLLPSLPAPPTIVRSREGHFMDKPDSVISLINLATLRSLEEKWGVELDPLRFRANIYIDGLRPWEEFDLIGGKIRIGGATFSVDRRNGRCGATNVNPASGRRDLDIPASLRAAFGHKDLGIYLIVREPGAIAVGDTLYGSAVASAETAPPQIPTPTASQRRFICRGCYYIYDEAAGLPQQSFQAGTSFSELPPSWRCPDCGTEKTNFRPHVAPKSSHERS